MKRIISIAKKIIVRILSSRRRTNYIKDYKECIAINPELGKPAEGEKEWLNKWRKYDRKVSLLSYRIFSRYIGPDINILPMEVCVNILEPVLTPGYLAAFYNDKNSFGLLYRQDEMPITYIRNIRGAYYDANYNPISGNLTDLIHAENVIIKPSTDSSGRGVALFTQQDGVYKDKYGNILSRHFLDAEYKSDFLVQERFVQSDYMAQFNPSSVNTIRISTFKNPTTGEVHYLRGIVRIGGAGSIVDNAHSGGRFIGIDDNGVFGKYVCDQVGRTSPTHGNIDFSTHEYKVPNFEQVKAFALEISKRFIHHNLLALDIVLNKDNTPKMLEINVQGFSAWLFQFTSGTAFREYTDSVVEYCAKDINNHLPQIMR